MNQSNMNSATECTYIEGNNGDTFRKYHVVVHCDSSLPLIARKIFNVLISLDDSRYGSDEVQTVSENEVVRRLGKSRKHIAYYREQFILLGKSNFTFYGYGENNQRIYGTCSILSGAIVDDGKQEWMFSTPTKIMEWVRQRSNQITLSLSIQHALGSKYSLALYETFLCKLDDSSTRTISLTLNEIRFITCGEEKHQEYKYLKKQVIKPALEELSENSNLSISIASELRQSRKVISVNFEVKRKNGSDEEHAIVETMNQTYGIDMGMAKRMAKEYKREQIENGLAYTRQQLEVGAIVALNGRKQPNIGGFTVNAIRKGLIPSRAGILAELNRRRDEGRGDDSKAPEDNKQKLEGFRSNDPERFEKLKKDFLRQADPIIKGLLEKEGEENPIVRYQFQVFLSKKLRS